jgi:lysophospholipase L1-like esterase
MTRLARLLAAGLVATALLTSCSSAADDPGDLERQVEDVTDASAPPFERYVALGDSFTAGPLVPTTDVAGGCFRSDRNYPALVAEQLDVDELVDVSCSGATTQDLTQRQQTVRDASVPPQLRVLSPETDLVTLGIGGNDFDLFHTLVATCSRLRSRDPGGSPCADVLSRRGVDLVAETDRISRRVEDAVRQVERRAPNAEILLVGYLRLTPSTSRCPELPFARGDYAFGMRVSRALNDALARAARRTGVGFVDMYTASEGHDVCSDEPWVNGVRTQEGEALAFHPFADGMEAVAEQVLGALS